MLKELQRDRILSGLLLVGVGALLLFVVRDFGSGLPEAPRDVKSPGMSPRLPTRYFDGLLAPSRVPGLGLATNQAGPFATLHFQPPPKPPPPKPTTRKVELLYMGSWQAGEGPRRAMVRLGDAPLTLGQGSNVVADLFVAGIELQTLILTNPAAQAHVLQFNVKTNLEVPIP